MTLPGFSANASLYRTNVPYRSSGALVRADGLVPQNGYGNIWYGKEYWACVRDCGYRVCPPDRPCSWTEPRDPMYCNEFPAWATMGLDLVEPLAPPPIH
jgi:hypothetical protein